VSELPAVVDGHNDSLLALQKAEYSRENLRKLARENWLRVFGEVW
jgi:microsomal dipeptidase-like Zn-dependent dipeptidase